MKHDWNLLKSYKRVAGEKYIRIYLIYFSYFIFSGPLEQLLSVALVQKGYDEAVYGLLLSVLNLIHIVLPGVVGIIATLKNSYHIAMFSMILCLVSSIGIGCSDGIITLVFMALLVCARTIYNYSLGNSINYVIEEENRGKYFALRDLFLFGSISLGMMLSSVYLKEFDIDSLYVRTGILFVIPFVFIASFYSYQRKRSLACAKKQEEKDENKRKYTKAMLVRLIHDKRFAAYLLIEFCTSIYAVSMNFLPLYGLKIGISVSEIMALFGSVTIINAVIGVVIGHFSDISGRKWYYVIDLGFDMIPAVMYATTGNRSVFVAAILISMLKDILAPISYAYFYDCFSDEDGTMVLGVVSSVSNALGLVIPLFVSLLWTYSPRMVFLIGGLGSVTAAVIAAVMLPNVKVRADSGQNE